MTWLRGWFSQAARVSALEQELARVREENDELRMDLSRARQRLVRRYLEDRRKELKRQAERSEEGKKA